MKCIAFSFSLILMSVGLSAQINVNAGLDQVYRDFMVQSHSQFTKTITDDFLSKGGEKRFFDKFWVIGGATNNFDITISGNYYFNFDFVGQELYAKWKDSVIAVNTNYVKRFFLLGTDGTHHYVKSESIDEQGKFFFESLAFDENSRDSAKVQLLKLRKTKIVKAKKDDYLANFSGDYSDTYDNDISYYLVFPDKRFTKIKLNKKSLRSALSPAYSAKADQYLKQVKEINEASAADLVRTINQ